MYKKLTNGEELNLGVSNFSFSEESSEENSEIKLDEIFRPVFSVYTA